MASVSYELNPVSRITVGAIGVPGQRLFLLQASTSDQVLTLKLEKEQVSALARGIQELLDKLEQQEQIPSVALSGPPREDLELQEPVEPQFAVVQMGLAFDSAVGLMVLVLAGLTDPDDEEASTARLWATPEQMHAVAEHAQGVVSGGRPICPLCGRPMDPGHSCPKGNGHGSAELP